MMGDKSMTTNVGPTTTSHFFSLSIKILTFTVIFTILSVLFRTNNLLHLDAVIESKLSSEEPSSSSEESSSLNTKEEDEYIDHRFNRWVDTREKLCPNGLPNLTFSTTLFDLARYELNVTEYNNNYNNKSDVQNIFFNGFYQAGKNYTAFQGFKSSTNLSLVYVSIWKAGSNQITSWQSGIFSKKNKMVYKPENFNPDRHKICLVTAIRDPISHFLSGYNEMEFRWKLKWDRNPFPNHKLGSLERFENFVLDLAKEHINNKNPIYLHVFPMSRILPALNDMGLKLTGYLPSITNLSKEWPKFLLETCPDVIPSEFSNITMEKMGQHNSSKDPLGTYQAAKDAWSKYGPTSRALCILHAMDYACYTDLPDGIPDLCQSVYDSDVFINSVYNNKLTFIN